jgi:hypothetical protein
MQIIHVDRIHRKLYQTFRDNLIPYLRYKYPNLDINFNHHFAEKASEYFSHMNIQKNIKIAKKIKKKRKGNIIHDNQSLEDIIYNKIFLHFQDYCLNVLDRLSEEASPAPTEEASPTPTEEASPAPTEEVSLAPTEEASPPPPSAIEEALSAGGRKRKKTKRRKYRTKRNKSLKKKSLKKRKGTRRR